jgi:Zn-finger nucleic acid-binding protein
VSLSKLRLKDVEIDRCLQCKGAWFDPTELNRLMSAAAKKVDIPSNAAVSERKCPRCSVNLHQFQYPGTEAMVDTCGACKGIWLDAKEFEAIREARKEQVAANGEHKSIFDAIGSAIGSLVGK